MNPTNNSHSIAESIALSQLKSMPIFEKVGEIDFQRMLSLMEAPVRAIDTIMGKEQARKVAKQLLIQNLALQTTVRNLQIEMQNAAQDFEECFDELEKALKTKGINLEELLAEIGQKQDDAEIAEQVIGEAIESRNGPVDTDGNNIPNKVD